MHGFEHTSLSDIETAVGEAIANAIEHGSRFRGFYTIQCNFECGVLNVSVSDGGAGFDDGTRPGENIRERRTPSLRGYGIYLMRTLMNRVSFQDGGRTVVLEKRLTASVAGDPAGSTEFGP
jgi:anti-sigma regulatory factor (Ser/Thr protein kinase)